MAKAAEMDDNTVPTPFLLHGQVVKGFQRGSKELGFPTANLNFVTAEGKQLKKQLKQGVYHGFARVRGVTYVMAMSVGDNPHYGNADVTVEVHVLHTFPEDFYGDMVTCLVTGYIRAMTPFDSLDALIAAIQNDCSIARQELSTGTSLSKFSSHAFLANPSPESAGELLCIM